MFEVRRVLKKHHESLKKLAQHEEQSGIDMKPVWIIQTNMDGVDTEPMIKEVLAQGMMARPLEHHLGASIDFSEYDLDDCVVCYGDIDFVRQVVKRAPFVPGAWCNFRNMKCSTYYAYLGEHLLNRYYIILPIGDLLERWSPNRSLFVRPDSGAKPFIGQVIAPDDKYKIQGLVQSVGPETLVVVAQAKEITSEWRLVICDRKVVTGSRYLPTELGPSSLTTPLLRLAEKIASNDWQPDICYTVDIAESGGELYLLEINSFSCAGFYKCNISDIVCFASKAAVKEWEDYQA